MNAPVNTGDWRRIAHAGQRMSARREVTSGRDLANDLAATITGEALKRNCVDQAQIIRRSVDHGLADDRV